MGFGFDTASYGRGAHTIVVRVVHGDVELVRQTAVAKFNQSPRRGTTAAPGPPGSAASEPAYADAGATSLRLTRHSPYRHPAGARFVHVPRSATLPVAASPGAVSGADGRLGPTASTPPHIRSRAWRFASRRGRPRVGACRGICSDPTDGVRRGSARLGAVDGSDRLVTRPLMLTREAPDRRGRSRTRYQLLGHRWTAE